ncbi:hypothetical protein NDU88_005439 [Pleurodeles waltl]|uniref:Uncharacterized protein n=1 Tax=Pleurodeles waltl TaxID=8319 RepID=A0AAV7NP18_PLEWA|nr:hypothetical protein NDU88_005439 [Pleurodeles waltl]
MISVVLEWKGGRRTLWVLPERKDVVQARAFSWIPASWRRADRGPDVVSGGDEGGLRAVVTAKTRLGRVQDVVDFEVAGQLFVDHLLGHFCREREQGDGTEVLEVLGVRLGLLQKGVDLGVLPAFWEGCCLEGTVDCFPEVGRDGCAGFVEDVVRAGVRWGSGVDGVHGFDGVFVADAGPDGQATGASGSRRGGGLSGGCGGVGVEAVVDVGDLAVEEGGQGVAQVLRWRDVVGDGAGVGEFFHDAEELFGVVCVVV